MVIYIAIAVVAFAAGYLVRRNNPKGNVSDFIDKLDDTIEDDVKEKLRELKDKL